MIRRRHVALTLFVALGLIAGCGGNSTTAKPDSASTQAGVGVPAPALLYPHRCRPSQIAIAESAQISPATGQNPISIALTNEGTEVCLLYGYPTVALLDASGKRLPFRISHSGDQMITSRRPVAVRLAPRQSAFFPFEQVQMRSRRRASSEEAHRWTTGHPLVWSPQHADADVSSLRVLREA
jgi:hypothetical protein